MQELAVGQRVICKHKNGRYYHSEVLELSPTTFYEVVFDDGSYSDNLFPEDIEVSMGLFPESLFMLTVRTDGALLCSALFVFGSCAHLIQNHVTFPSEPRLRPTRTPGQRTGRPGAVDRRVDIRSQVCHFSHHPHVYGKPGVMFVSRYQKAPVFFSAEVTSSCNSLSATRLWKLFEIRLCLDAHTGLERLI